MFATVTLLPFSIYAVDIAKTGNPVTITVLVALLVCLIPTTIGGLLSAIGLAGIGRMLRANVIATSGRAVEAAGDVDVLLLDKTGTITLGNRQASNFLHAPGVTEHDLADVAQLASLADETPEGRSVVVLAKQKFNLRERDIKSLGATFVPFSAHTRMSGVNLEGREIRKGASDAIRAWVESKRGTFPGEVLMLVDNVARRGSTPLVVAESAGGSTRVLGVIELKDIVKGGIKERFAQLRRMGIRTVMITGDNRLTAAAIAAEAGVDDFLAEATPEAKLKLIRDTQGAGRLVAMIVEIGKQLLMTRGSLTTFSIANDVAKYFAIIPAAFASTYPQLNALNVMRLATPGSAILSAVIFNAIIIIALIPLALKGVRYRPVGAAAVLRDNTLIYGVGGIVVPFVGIKLIDIILTAMGMA
jgi:K+-transporting ATPase ATPase B chain